MANTWTAEVEGTGEVVAEFRSVDFDPVELYDRHGEVIVRDKTDRNVMLGTVKRMRDIHSDSDFIALYPNT